VYAVRSRRGLFPTEADVVDVCDPDSETRGILRHIEAFEHQIRNTFSVRKSFMNGLRKKVQSYEF
jgi:hypothetical protein